MTQQTFHEFAFGTLQRLLTPSKPVKTQELLRGREKEFSTCVHQLKYGSSPFIYGDRGIGKTSLAFSSAFQVSKSDREPVYVACAPKASFLSLATEALKSLSDIAVSFGALGSLKISDVEATLGLSPALKFTWHASRMEPVQISNMLDAIRLVRDFDKIIREPDETVIVFDELENLSDGSQADIAYFIKQVGDQDVSMRFMYVGIADNIQQIVGEHKSAPRYIHQVPLKPLKAQAIIDIVAKAAEKIEVEIPRDTLLRIAMMANGYPHFAHLTALHVLTVSVNYGEKEVTEEIYREGLSRAVEGSVEMLKATYRKATFRKDDINKHVLWAMGHVDMVDQRIDTVISRYREIGRAMGWEVQSEEYATSALQKLRTKPYGNIIMSTLSGSGRVNRYVRFSEPLMRAYIRLSAANEGVDIGSGKELQSNQL